MATMIGDAPRSARAAGAVRDHRVGRLFAGRRRHAAAARDALNGCIGPHRVTVRSTEAQPGLHPTELVSIATATSGLLAGDDIAYPIASSAR